MPKPVCVIYTLRGCIWCTKLKKEMRDRGYVVKERAISRGDQPLTLPDGRTKGYTYPQMFVAFGGYEASMKRLGKRK